MLRIALRPRYLGLLAAMVVATIVCGVLAGWQWDRAHHALTEKANGAEQLGDLREVVQPGDAVTNAIVGDTVTVSGRYASGQQIIVPGRSVGEVEAVIVVSDLLVELEDGTLAHLPVARGWLPAEEITGPDGALDPELAPAPPEGEVALSGRLEASEAATGGLSASVASEIATPLLVNEWGSPMYAGYLALDEPGGGLQPLPAAESRFSQGLDWQNIGYSFQWVLFGLFFLYLWWRSVRTARLDELADQREAMQRTLGDAAPPADGSAAPLATTPPGPRTSTDQLSDKDV
ncbi:SURF1 family protein [Brachybacterium sp. YJGR34]|uniref:SURF1 family protein n=1 Tax=Brachybacterium sp. YJGR34 TaxID=2059911 RepID=UPI001300496A|nr:SURF1 family protein [Brachybacterium sp. YJGR34]